VTGCQGIRIIQSNDDGWAELYLRSFHDSLLSGGHDAVVSAPADNQSGRGKSPRAVNNEPVRETMAYFSSELQRRAWTMANAPIRLAGRRP
jgi:broad specificity polyphosphatase/5'/3'-nucleotidase SurE